MTSPAFIYATQGALFGEREVVGFGSSAFCVREIPREKANDIIRRNHYSRAVYSTSFVHLGVYAGELLGVFQFGPAMNPVSQSSVVSGTGQDEYLELNRMWLDDKLPRNSESRAMAYSITYIRKKFPRIAWIQSFADQRCGRFGVVYQACNFIYCGEHTSTFWEIDGEFFHNSAMTSDPARRPVNKFVQDRRDRATPHKLRQFRYLYFLKRNFRSRLLLKQQPYPKHAVEGSMENRPDSSREGEGQFLDTAPSFAAGTGADR